jgi:hypothetical protein
VEGANRRYHLRRSLPTPRLNRFPKSLESTSCACNGKTSTPAIEGDLGLPHCVLMMTKMAAIMTMKEEHDCDREHHDGDDDGDDVDDDGDTYVYDDDYAGVDD